MGRRGRWLLGWSLGVAACTGGGSPASGTGTSSDDGSAADTRGVSTTSTTSSSSSSSSSSGPPGTTTGVGSTGLDSTGSTTGGDSSGTTTGRPREAPCVVGCEVEFACGKRWPDVRSCVTACEANLVEAEAYEIACRAAWEDLHVCLGTLSCEEFAQWANPTRFPYPCVSADQVLAFECKGQ